VRQPLGVGWRAVCCERRSTKGGGRTATTGKEAYVASLPDCDVCKFGGGKRNVAAYDGATTQGPWAYMCEEHFASHGVGLGTGVGQRLIVGERPVMSHADKTAAIQRAINSNDFGAVEDIVGDGDLAEFL
jgi:hypothetical protein